VLAGQLAATLRKVTESRPNSRRDPANGRLTKSRQRSAETDLRRSWRESIAGTTPAKWARDSAYKERVLATSSRMRGLDTFFYCVGWGMASSRLRPTRAGAGATPEKLDAEVATAAPFVMNGRWRDLPCDFGLSHPVGSERIGTRSRRVSCLSVAASALASAAKNVCTSLAQA
jgi:hypothetical protein